jgi:hypothetical protein
MRLIPPKLRCAESFAGYVVSICPEPKLSAALAVRSRSAFRFVLRMFLASSVNLYKLVVLHIHLPVKGFEIHHPNNDPNPEK